MFDNLSLSTKIVIPWVALSPSKTTEYNSREKFDTYGRVGRRKYKPDLTSQPSSPVGSLGRARPELPKKKNIYYNDRARIVVRCRPRKAFITRTVYNTETTRFDFYGPTSAT